VLKKRLKFRSKWAVLYEDLNPKHTVNLWYNIFFITRRLLYVETSFTFEQFPCQQIQILLYMNLFNNIYIQGVKPMKSLVLNKLEIYNDILVFYVTLHFFFFTDLVPDLETQYLYGYSCICLVGLGIFFDLLYIFGKNFLILRLILIKYFRLLKQMIKKYFRK